MKSLVTILRMPAAMARFGLSARTAFVLMSIAIAILTLALSGLVAARLVASTRDAVEREMAQEARDINLQIEHKVFYATIMLRSMVGDNFRRGDMEAVYRQAADVAREVGFDFVLRHEPSGELVFNTAIPWGALPQGIPFPMGKAIHDALRAGNTIVSDVFFAPRVKRYIVDVCVPIGEPGAPDYLFCAAMGLDLFAKVLQDARIENGWTATIMDRNGVIVARSKNHDSLAGRQAAIPAVRALPGTSGTASGINNEQIPFFWVGRRSDVTGWVVAVGIPQASLNEPRRIALGGLLAVGFVVVVGSAVAAHRASSPWARSMRELHDAVTVAQRQPEQVPAAASASFSKISDILAAASKELRAGEDRRRFELAAAGIATWQWELASGTVYWSERLREIYGVGNEVKASLENFLARLHPDDRPAIVAAVEREISKGEGYDREYRILRANTGEERWVHAKVRVECDKSGRPARVLGVGMDITAGKQNEFERIDLRRRLMRAQEDERQRLARELHDEIGQFLVAAMLDVKRLEPETSAGVELLHRLESQLDKMNVSLHRVARELRPTAIDDFGIGKALADQIADWSTRFGIEIDYQCLNVDLDTLPADVGIILYRICQESLTNIAKHAAGATDISIIVDRAGHMLRLTIEDNGGGFDPAVVAPAEKNGGGLGIAGMRERLAVIGGELMIESSISVGTTIFARIALETTEAARWLIEPA